MRVGNRAPLRLTVKLIRYLAGGTEVQQPTGQQSHPGFAGQGAKNAIVQISLLRNSGRKLDGRQT